MPRRSLKRVFGKVAELVVDVVQRGQQVPAFPREPLHEPPPKLTLVHHVATQGTRHAPQDTPVKDGLQILYPQRRSHRGRRAAASVATMSLSPSAAILSVGTMPVGVQPRAS